MDQGGGLQDVIRTLAFHLARRNAMQFRIDQSGGLLGGILVAPLHPVQQQSELRRRACLLWLLAFQHSASV